MPPVVQNPNNQRQQNQPQIVPLVPFTAAAHEHVEPGTVYTSVLGAASVQAGPFDVPSYGYLRHIYLQVESTGGVIGTFAPGADFPFNILQNITLLDVNGAPLFGPLDGFAALQANIFGGYAFRADPRQLPGYSAAGATPSFILRIPVEISHYDGLGSIANQNAAAAYKLSFTLNNLAALGTGSYGTPPTITVRPFVECWSLPNSSDMAGRPQMQAPPAHGTAQYWSSNIADILLGQNTVQFTRMGNLIRNIVVITRNTAGVRIDTPMPDPILYNWDARQLFNESQRYRINAGYERVANVATRDTGVFAYTFDHSVKNQAGDDTPNLWLPTVQATRMEFQGSSALAGSMQIITNDVAPAEVTPAERYLDRSDTGYNPQNVNVANAF